MHASLDPVVEQPVASPPSGACQRSARMLTQRDSSSAVCGYSSLSIMFLSRHSVISTCASGSIHVVTNVARFSRAFPSSISSSRTTCAAVPGRRVLGHRLVGDANVHGVDVELGTLTGFPGIGVQRHGALPK